MKTLALRIYLTVLAVLLLFTLGSGWLAQRHMDQVRQELQVEAQSTERTKAWGELMENSLPESSQSEAAQAQALEAWATRLRLPMALDAPDGRRIATSSVMEQRLKQQPESQHRLQQSVLSDGRVLWLLRPMKSALRRDRGGDRAYDGATPSRTPAAADMWENPLPWLMPGGSLLRSGSATLLALFLLFVAVSVGAWPVVNRLTRRLKALRNGVELFGSGQLNHRVEVEGRDEVAAVAQSFNQAAQQVEELVTSHRSLLANASHELRSPLARLKMAVAMMAELPPERTQALRDEINEDIRELDALVEEVLLASRLDARTELNRQTVDLVLLLTEEARRFEARLQVSEDAASAGGALQGDERLVRRAVRNLLENAKRYGGNDEPIVLSLDLVGPHMRITVSDRGSGVPEDQRERIFEAFYRLPGHAEYSGGVGLGLSLVRQIAQRHGGHVRVEAREGGGSDFSIELPR